MRELTDSYCERCGTRYTFGPSPTKGPSLTGARLLAKGLKNFVMTDGTSMDEAMAAARIDVTKDESSRVSEEFHRTFNFCMTCRQYACDKCWNENQGACLSCAPLWDQEPVVREGHLIIRTPVLRPDLRDTGKATSLADVSQAPRALQMPCRGPRRIRCPGGPPLVRAAMTTAPWKRHRPFPFRRPRRCRIGRARPWSRPHRSPASPPGFLRRSGRQPSNCGLSRKPGSRATMAGPSGPRATIRPTLR